MNFEGALILGATVGLVIGIGWGAQRLLSRRFEAGLSELVVGAAFGWGVLSWWGVTLAEAGQFTPLVFLGPPAFALVALALALATRAPAVPARRIDLATVAAVVGVVTIAAVLYFPVFDVRAEARDPGTYFHAGRYLAQHGEINFTDPSVTGLGPETRAAVFPPVGGHARAFHNSRFPGFYLEELDTGRVVAQAAPVFPVWVGVGYWVAGDAGAQGAAAVLIALGACLLSVLAATLVGRPGLVAGPLFAVGFVPGWFARYSAAEAAALVAVLLGTIGLARYRESDDRFYALAAGLGFGLAPLAKAELAVAVVPLAGLWFVDLVTQRMRRRDVVYLWLPLALLAVHTVVHAAGWLWPYYFDVVRQFVAVPTVFLGQVAAAALLALAATAFVRWVAASRLDGVRRFVAGESRAGRGLRWVGAAGVVAFSIYGYWWRPYAFALDGTSARWNMANHVELGFAISPWLVFLAAFGAALLITNRGVRPGHGVAAFVLLFLGTQILYERNITPELMWAYRRYVAIVLPVHYLMSALAIGWVAERLLRWRVPAMATWLVLLAPAAWHHVATGNEIRAHQEFSGAAAAVADLAQELGPEDAVLFETRTNRGLLRFEAALGLGGQPAVYRLQGPDFDYDVFRSIARDRSRHGGAVYLVTTGYLNGLEALRADPVAAMEWDTQMFEAVQNFTEVRQGGEIRLPDRVVPLRFGARLYRLRGDGRLAPLPEHVVAGERRGELDVGLWDEPFLVGSQLHVPEYAGVHNFRWTTGSAGFLLPGTPPNAEAVVLRVMANEDLAVQEVEAWLDDVHLGSAPVPPEWGDVRFTIPADWEVPSNGIARLRVAVPTAIPADVDPASTDRRTLGVRVDKVFWTRAEPMGER